MSKNLIICDLDGTIANIEHRLHYIKGPHKDWDSFNKACVDDTVNKDVREILWNMYDAGRDLSGHPDLRAVSDRTVYFFSGRSDVVRKETEEWLREHVVAPSMCDDLDRPKLFMRKEGDFRNDVEVKREMIHSLNITPDDVLCILDDRQGVVDMWRQEGFRCLQVDAWKEEPKRHHLMDADLDDLNTAELKFLIEHERGHFNEVADRLLSTLIGTERELRKCQEGEIKPDELMGHIDVVTSKIFDDTKGIETSNWRLKKENDNG
jgi:hypothetical protein